MAASSTGADSTAEFSMLKSWGMGNGIGHDVKFDKKQQVTEVTFI